MNDNKPEWNYYAKKYVFSCPREETILSLLKELYNEAYNGKDREDYRECLSVMSEGMKYIIETFSKEKNDETQM